MRVFITLLTLPFVFCGYTNESDTCNPQAGRFIKDTHYIDGSMLTENGNWDYREWDTYRERVSKYRPDSNCIPLEYPESMQRRLYELEQTVDLER